MAESPSEPRKGFGCALAAPLPTDVGGIGHTAATRPTIAGGVELGERFGDDSATKGRSVMNASLWVLLTAGAVGLLVAAGTMYAAGAGATRRGRQGAGQRGLAGGRVVRGHRQVVERFPVRGPDGLAVSAGDRHRQARRRRRDDRPNPRRGQLSAVGAVQGLAAGIPPGHVPGEGGGQGVVGDVRQGGDRQVAMGGRRDVRPAGRRGRKSASTT